MYKPVRDMTTYLTSIPHVELTHADAEVKAWDLLRGIYGNTTDYELLESLWHNEDSSGYAGPFKLGVFKFANRSIRLLGRKNPEAVWIEISADGTTREVTVLPEPAVRRRPPQGRTE